MKKDHTINDLISLAETYLPKEHISLIKEAYDYAAKKHEGQFRLSREPYIMHPLEVSIILVSLKQDSFSIIAGLLHDTLEDSNATKDEIKQLFGPDVCYLVEGVTKLGALNFTSEEEHLAENFRKLFLAMAKDLRVVIIKLADRLHNMRTLNFLSKDRQIRMAKETKEIFVPLAHRLGMGSIKWELEDLSFYYLKHEEFQKIKHLVASRREERETYIHNFTKMIEPIAQKVCAHAKILGRPKHFFSIYKKMQAQRCSYEEVYDTLGVRIMVDTLSQCYELFGLIHAKFKPINRRIKDYIAIPKSNLYQSLHTTVIGPEGKNIELQIRTFEMDQIAENGIAAHWRYKEGKAQDKYNADFTWLTQIVETLKEHASPGEHIQNLKLDLFEDEVFIFTPKGDVHCLPKGATPLDFAYKVHTEVGHACTGAKIHGEIVPLDYVLKSGDQIEILASKKQQPKISWLNLVKTHQAKNKIKQWFRKQKVEENLEKGKELLEQTLINAGFVPKFVFNSERFIEIIKRFNQIKAEEFFIQIGLGEILPGIIVKYLVEEESKTKVVSEAEILKDYQPKITKKPAKQGIKVLGASSIMVQFAKCCMPIPYDEIIGFVTKGYGVTIHRKSCKNILNLSGVDRDRIIDVEWEEANLNRNYAMTIVIEAFDRLGILKDVISKITETKTNIIEVKSKTLLKGGNIKTTIVVDVKDLDHFESIKKAIQSVSDVYSVYRV
ncbi:MAG: bifunctional (p)ppGpp synthetase/guanosine-3',5'-bis(diphosphate) 3'-pyrophosphohydrolase [Candidatus Margulisiibacteriota bacterium]|jgi:GTP pyrophosphokinase